MPELAKVGSSKFMVCGLEWMWIASITLLLVKKGSMAQSILLGLIVPHGLLYLSVGQIF